MPPKGFSEASITLIPKSDKEKKLQTYIPHKHKEKNSYENFSKSNPTLYKRDTIS